MPTQDEIRRTWGRDNGHPLTPLWRALVCLPSDYTDYGGAVERWADNHRAYPDCSCGCRYARYIEDSGDWLVCSSPTSPRLGLLTWEHQAGADCFVAAEESEDDE